MHIHTHTHSNSVYILPDNKLYIMYFVCVPAQRAYKNNGKKCSSFPALTTV